MTSILKLGPKHVPHNSVFLVPGDIHGGIEDRPAMELMMQCAEDQGVTHVANQGDTQDCQSISSHPKDPNRRASVREEAEGMHYYYDWCRKDCKQVYYLEGNHEGRWNRLVQANPGMVGACDFPEAAGLRRYGFTFLPQGSQIRIGSLVIEHGDHLFKGGGPKHAAANVLERFPDQTTFFGHIHRIQEARRSALDAEGVMRTRAAVSVGHMSIPQLHADYMGRAPNWQQGFALIRFWYDGKKVRWTHRVVEVLRDARNWPIFELDGVVYR